MFLKLTEFCIYLDTNVKIIKYSLKREGVSKKNKSVGWEKILHQETLVTEYYAQIVGLSEDISCKAF